jgi:hypothetical protein
VPNAPARGECPSQLEMSVVCRTPPGKRIGQPPTLLRSLVALVSQSGSRGRADFDLIVYRICPSPASGKTLPKPQVGRARTFSECDAATQPNAARQPHVGRESCRSDCHPRLLSGRNTVRERRSPLVRLHSRLHCRAGHWPRDSCPCTGAETRPVRRVFGVCTLAPAQIVALQKIQGQRQDSGALETIAQERTRHAPRGDGRWSGWSATIRTAPGGCS